MARDRDGAPRPAARSMTKTTQTKADAITRGLVLAVAVILAAIFALLLRRRGAPGQGSLTPYLVAVAALALLHAWAIAWRSGARQKLLLVTFSIAGSVYLA